MQKIVIDQPYSFVPPKISWFWHRTMRRTLPRRMRKEYGIADVECVGAEKLRASVAAGHGVMVVGNHCRPCDPFVLDYLAKEAGRPFKTIASWHLFMAGRIQRFLLQRIGCFSVYREGMDRESLKCAVGIVSKAEYPLSIFAEGIVSRSNDRLLNFMEGPSFIARAAAKQRGQGKVVVHPVFIRYFFEGDLAASISPVIEEIEQRLSWQPQDGLSLRERIWKLGDALLALKELEYFGTSRSGSRRERLVGLMERILSPLEARWCDGRGDGDTMVRVKRLRSAILPDLVKGNLNEDGKAICWRHLADLYLVQQLHCYPGDYLNDPTPERILETLERYEEDLTDIARPHFPMHVVISVGDAIEISPERQRAPDGDPLNLEIRRSMEEMLERSKSLRRKAPTGTGIS
jgi:1-acyl-sn-glycerol-3-phosphate acyltransferase